MLSKSDTIIRRNVNNSYIRVDPENGLVYGKRGRLLKQRHDKWGYVQVGIDGYPIYLHRIIMFAVYGDKLFEYDTVDHIDGDKNNNRISNLQFLTRADNLSKRFTAYSENDAQTIVKRFDSGEWDTIKQAAEDLFIDEKTMTDILRARNAYKNIFPSIMYRIKYRGR